MLATIHPIPAFSDNYIWAYQDPSTGNAGVVDPGDATPVIEYLNRTGKVLSHILITHHHPDHVGGVAELVKQYNPVIYGPVSEHFQAISKPVCDGDHFELFGEQLAVIAVPGHTLDHIAYYIENPCDKQGPILFCGDTLFAAGCGRIFEGNPGMMFKSLQKLANLDARSRVYCTHEYTLANLRFAIAADPDNDRLKQRIQRESLKREQDLPTLPSTIGLELETNPFLRCHEPELRSSADSISGTPNTTPEQVFSSLRKWKDNFKS